MNNEALNLLTDSASLSVHPLSPRPALVASAAQARFPLVKPLASDGVGLYSLVPLIALSTCDVWRVARLQREAQSNGLTGQRRLPSPEDRRYCEPTALAHMGSECMG